MRFIVSDNDMTNRYEQTMLVLSTLSHFGYKNYDHVVMHGGHIQQIGSPKTIYDEPKNAFVANFIGESNIISGEMLEGRIKAGDSILATVKDEKIVFEKAE